MSDASQSEQSPVLVGCLACSSKARAAHIRSAQEKLKIEKKKQKEDLLLQKKELAEKKKQEREEKLKSGEKKKPKRKRENSAAPAAGESLSASASHEDLSISCPNVMVEVQDPQYEYQNNKFRLSGLCSACNNKVSSFIDSRKVPDEILEKMQLTRESLIKKKQPKKKKEPAQKKKKQEEEDKEVEQESSSSSE